MANGPDAEKLKKLDDRLDALKERQAPEPRADEHYSQAHLGWRMVIELVAGIVIGFAIGYGLDALFGTLPIFLVVFVLLGFAGGVRTMMRTAKEVQDDLAAHEARREKDAGHG